MVQRDETTLSELRRGALVLASDYELGSLDSIRPAQGDEGPMLIVRHGYADYLLVVPADAIADSEPTRDRKSTRLNSSHIPLSRMPSSA